jgi:aspartate-semialdehyde dehydrogenase
MTRGGLRIALAGASGALASEVLEVIDERRLPVAEILPFATDRSLGQDVEFQDQVIPIEPDPPNLRGVDLLLVCTPRAAALELVREALRAEAFCIDCSGSLGGAKEVPLLVSDLCAPGAVLRTPVIASPTAAALAWALVLSPLAREVGLTRVVGTLLQSASQAGRAGAELLSHETMALLNQQDAPESDLFPGPIAFDCAPAPGPVCEGQESGDELTSVRRESDVARDLTRLLQSLGATAGDPAASKPEVSIAVSAVQVPTFVGEGSVLAIQTQRAIAPLEAAELLRKAPGVKLWEGGESGPSMRDASRQDVALVGRLRRDASLERGLLLWCTSDPLRLAATNAIKLAETRLRLN